MRLMARGGASCCVALWIEKGRRLALKIRRWIVHHWLRRMNHKGLTSSVRAVFLGDFVSTAIVTKGVFEGHLLEVLEKQILPLVPKDKVCLDIGANIGNHACIFARHFTRVVSFEPNPVVHKLLEVNAMGAGIEPVNIGLSDAPGNLLFKQNTRNFGASAVVERKEDADFEIAVVALDDYCAQEGIGDIGFVKIDVEGHELKVLKGARKTLAEHGPILAMEGLYGDDPDLGAEVEAELIAAGYTHFYRAVPRVPLAKWLAARGHTLHRGLLAVLLPDHVQRASELEEAAGIKGENHELFIAARAPLSLPSF